MKGNLLTPQVLIALILGALVGSFLNVCAYRIPEGTFWTNLRSVCRGCGRTVPAYFNVPIISYFILRGRTACCKSKLSIQYPVVELITAACFGVLATQFFPLQSVSGAWRFSELESLRYGYAAFVTSVLILTATIDARLYIIPDKIMLPLLLCTPLAVWIHPDLHWKESVIGFFVGGGLLYVIAWAYHIIRKRQGLGFGDVKLLAFIGGWLGYQAVFPTLLIGSVGGSFLGIILLKHLQKWDGKPALPFGPFLSAGAIVHLLFGNQLHEWLGH